MPWLVVIWTIVTLCLEVCYVSISPNCKVFRKPLLVLLEIIDSMLMLHRQYLTFPPFPSSDFESVKHFGHSFAFEAPKIWNELPHDVLLQKEA